MLFFSSSEQVIYTQYDKATFDSVPTCQEFLFHNKVQLTLDLFDNHNQKGDMKGYEFFCESRYSTEQEQEPGQEI
jgi:hypothetical protein